MQNQRVIDWEVIRSEYPILSRQTYLNTPASGLIHPDVIRAGNKASEKYFEEATQYKEDWIFNGKEVIRKVVANYLGCNTTELAFCQNFSLQANMVAEMLVGHKKKVAVVKGDYPSLTLPWKLKGFEVNEFAVSENLTLDYDKLEDFLKQNHSEILAISHVQWNSGFISDLSVLSSICQRLGVLFILDATQSAGVLPLNIQSQPIDILMASTYKWLGAGFGNGFMYIKEGLIDEFTPRVGGFNSFLWDQAQPYYKPTIKSFEPGHLDHEAFARLMAAIKLHQSMGVAQLQQRVKDLMNYFLSKASERGIKVLGEFNESQRGSIAFVEGDMSVCKALLHEKVVTAPRGSGVRLGVHFYNSQHDIDRFVDVYSNVLAIT